MTTWQQTVRSRIPHLFFPFALLCSAGVMAADPGEALVSNRCAICHGAEGESSSSIFPRLAGQHADYLVKQLNDFQSGKRKSDTMNVQVQDLKPEEIRLAARYFSSKISSAHETQDGELHGLGRNIYNKGNPDSGVPACASCHGTQGLGAPQLPRLAGQHARYVSAQLKQFNRRERTNDNEIMHSIAAKLSELEIIGVAEYISTLH
jgi:cytochrome c553